MTNPPKFDPGHGVTFVSSGAVAASIDHPVSMRAVLPGRPPARLQSLSTVLWDGLRIVVRTNILLGFFLHGRSVILP